MLRQARSYKPTLNLVARLIDQGFNKAIVRIVSMPPDGTVYFHISKLSRPYGDFKVRLENRYVDNYVINGIDEPSIVELTTHFGKDLYLKHFLCNIELIDGTIRLYGFTDESNLMFHKLLNQKYKINPKIEK